VPFFNAENRNMSFLTLEEAGRMTGLCRASIYKELKAGRLKSYKVGPNNGRYKITNEHVEEYLKKRQTIWATLQALPGTSPHRRRRPA
jgi:excisionase family DNA binding protein